MPDIHQITMTAAAVDQSALHFCTAVSICPPVKTGLNYGTWEHAHQLAECCCLASIFIIARRPHWYECNTQYCYGNSVCLSVCPSI